MNNGISELKNQFEKQLEAVNNKVSLDIKHFEIKTIYIEL